MKPGNMLPAVVAAALLASAALATPVTATAKTATNLKCKGCVGKKDLGKKAVTKKAIGESVVRSKSIKDGTVRSADLAPAAKPTGVDWADGEQQLVLNAVETAARTVTITAPAPGYITVMAAWHFYSVNPGVGVCSLNDEIALDNDHIIAGEGDSNRFVPAAAVRTFEVNTGANSFYLVCFAGAGTSQVRNSSMSAVYTPSRL